MSFAAAFASRRRCTRRSRTSPSSSTARQSQNRLPPIRIAISSRCQCQVGRDVAAKLLGEQRPELQHPSPDCLIGDIQPALGQQILDIAEAEGEAKVQPTACRMMSGGNWWRAMRSLSFAIIAAGPKPAKVPVSIPSKAMAFYASRSDAALALFMEKATARGKELEGGRRRGWTSSAVFRQTGLSRRSMTNRSNSNALCCAEDRSLRRAGGCGWSGVEVIKIVSRSPAARCHGQIRAGHSKHLTSSLGRGDRNRALRARQEPTPRVNLAFGTLLSGCGPGGPHARSPYGRLIG